MGNIYDQFDPQPPANATQPDGPNIYDQFDPPAPKPMSATDQALDVAQGAGTGLLRGTAQLAGTPGDVQSSWNKIWDRAALGVAHKGFDWTGYGPQAGTPDREDFDKGWQALSDVGSAAAGPQSLPTSSQITSGMEGVTGKLPEPKTTAGKYTQSIAEYVPNAAMGPEGLLKKAVVGAVAPGVASEAAGQYFQGSPYEPYARMVGAVAGGAGLDLAGKAATNKVLGPVTAKALAKVGAPGLQERLAGERLLEGSSDPQALRQAVEPVNGSYQIVDDSKPTLFQYTGDHGIGQMERGDRTANPAPYLERKDDQNSARLAALESVQPTGNPQAVSAHLTDQLNQLDTITQGRIDSAKSTAQDAASSIGTGAGPEATGADLRARIKEANDAATAQERQLWKVVDPDKTLANSTDAITKATNDIYGSLTPTARDFLSPAEKTFTDRIGTYNPVEPFQQVADLRSNLAAAMRQEMATNGRSPSYGRMSRLMDSVQGTINDTIEQKAAQEAHAVSTGAMSAEDTMVARMRDRWNLGAGQQAAGVQGYAATGTGGSSAPAFGSSRVYGTAGSGGRGDGYASSDPRTATGNDLAANWDADAAARLKAASEATKTNKQTFNKGTVGQVMQPGAMAGDYRMPNSAVPAKIFPAGSNGYEAVKAYTKAAGTGPESVQSLESAAMESLRQRAVSATDGMLTQAGLDAWKKQHTHSLRAVDEISPGFSSRFDDAAAANGRVLQATADRTAKLRAYQSGAIGKLMNVGSHDEMLNRIGTIMGAPDRVTQTQNLVRASSNNPAAAAGLRRGYADWFSREITSMTEAGTSGERQIAQNRFQKLVSSRSPALSAVFDD